MSQPILPLVLNFNGGEISPLLKDRVDLDKYRATCSDLENYNILPYGAAEFRPGLLYAGEVKDSSKETRLIGWSFSTTTNFFLEIGDQYMRFWSNDGTQIDSGGSPYEIVTPWLEADIFAIQITQINDVGYLTCPGYAPQKLTRVSNTNWTIEEFDPIQPPLRAQNSTSTTLTASHTSGTSRTLTASANIFTSDHVGAYFQVSHYKDANYVTWDFSANDTSGSINVLGEWDLQTYGTWSADLIVERSYDNGTTWETIRSYHSGASGSGQRNIIDEGDEVQQCLLRLRVANRSSGGSSDTVYLEVRSARHNGLVKVTGYTSATQVTVDVIEDLSATSATTLWKEGAWSGERGFPRCSTYHDGRLYFGGSASEPSNIWASRVESIEDFQEGADADAGLNFFLASTESNTVQWLVSQTSLLVGTSGDEWRITGSSDDAITPSNIDAKRQTRIGSSAIQVGLANEAVIFIERQGKKVREFVFSFEVQGYIADELSLLAEHIPQGIVRQVAYQQQYDSRLWFVMEDGTAASMTYERRQEVAGWANIVTDGTFVSVGSIYGSTDQEDEVWFVVEREVNGATKKYIERLDPQAKNFQNAGTKSSFCYMDSSKRITLGSPGTAVSGLDHLEGETVRVVADGSRFNDAVVSSGSITLEKNATNVSVGLAYYGYLTPSAITIDFGGTTSRGRKTRIYEIVVNLYNSIGLRAAYRRSGYDWEDAYFFDLANAPGSGPTLTSGEKSITLNSPYSNRGEVTVSQNEPFPQTILSIVPKLTVHGN